MSSVKTVRFEEVKDVMDQMMGIPILKLSEKDKMVNEENNLLLDPNLIMEARHKIFQEPLPVSPTENSIFLEAERLLIEEEAEELFCKKQENLIDSELRKFQKELEKSRPKFSHTCHRKSLCSSDDEEFWKSAAKLSNFRKSYSRDSLSSQAIVLKDNIETSEVTVTQNEPTGYPGSIKITIKDKPVTESKEEQLEKLRIVFQKLRENAKDERRLREIRLKIERKLSRQRLEKFFHIWKKRVEDIKNLERKRKEQNEMTEERKIDLLVNAITEKQKELQKHKSILKTTNKVQVEEKKVRVIRPIVESPAQNRLMTQKRIIEEQRLKLAQQTKIIEELKAKQMECEAKKCGKDTVNTAKEVLTHCGGRTRRSLIQLLRQEGYRDKSSLDPPRVPSPPQFLMRMEARAEARRERVRKAEEARQRRIEEEKRKEENIRKEEEETRKRLQLEAQRDAKRLREEQEARKRVETEKFQKLNEKARKFYEKYLMRRYIIDPLLKLVETKHDYMRISQDHYQKSLLRKILKTWESETREQIRIKEEFAISTYQRNLLWYCFRDWKERVNETKQKYQVASDFHDLRLQEAYLRLWCNETRELKLRCRENEEIALDHYERRLKFRFFKTWKRYLEVAEEIKESERKRNQWRQLVQNVVPDFNPKLRGVAIDEF